MAKIHCYAQAELGTCQTWNLTKLRIRMVKRQPMQIHWVSLAPFIWEVCTVPAGGTASVNSLIYNYMSNLKNSKDTQNSREKM